MLTLLVSTGARTDPQGLSSMRSKLAGIIRPGSIVNRRDHMMKQHGKVLPGLYGWV